MTPKTFFNIILKIFGLFFLREIINSIPQIISGLIMLFTPEKFMDGLILFSSAVVILIFYIVMTHQLIFKSQTWVTKLKLDKDFNDEFITFKISATEVLKISLIVTISQQRLGPCRTLRLSSLVFAFISQYLFTLNLRIGSYQRNNNSKILLKYMND